MEHEAYEVSCFYLVVECFFVKINTNKHIYVNGVDQDDCAGFPRQICNDCPA